MMAKTEGMRTPEGNCELTGIVSLFETLALDSCEVVLSVDLRRQLSVLITRARQATLNY